MDHVADVEAAEDSVAVASAVEVAVDTTVAEEVVVGLYAFLSFLCTQSQMIRDFTAFCLCSGKFNVFRDFDLISAFSYFSNS